ncbi:MAG: HsdR family type I site-specific deoxyribonuclease, partial [Elusimicrobiota bacterium]|nr:HsdR family type I site-specific deoxyribonuclease [Elusimicrobiota bacterium]
MKTEIGAKEIRTQERLLKLFIDKLGYNYIGNWEDRQDNSNIEEKILRQYLVKLQKYSSFQINNAINKFRNAALNLNAGIMAANEEVYEKLRYGVTVDKDISKNKSKVFLIDWKNPIANNFSIAQEVSVKGANDKRPDLVIYVNGIALAVIELKRSTVSVHQGIRQNLDNQEPQFIPHFFTTIQLLFAGNDSEGLYYGVIKTPEKFWTRWKEINPNISNELDRSVLQMFDKNRLLEFIYDCIVFDGGIKKAARPHQYFALKAAQLRIKKKESGIIWHSQGTGKSLVMVWLANWIFENIADARILVITDRDELDKQIESAFKNVQEKPQRAVSGENLIKMLDKANPRLICALIHKFGAKDDNGGIKVGARKAEKSLEEYLDEVKKKLPDGFKAKGCIFVFIDECHRTQSGKLHSAMTEVLGKKIMMIGFTGTPLLKKDKKLSVEIFGSIIHSYKFDEAVADKVILDLRYEAREAPQFLGSKEKIDEWFEGKTQGLSNIAKNELKKRWAVMEKLFSSKDRMQRIAADICQDMDLKPVLSGKYGNAMLVADGIYQALRYWKFFQDTELKGHCAAVTSYDADINYIKDETTGSGETEEKQKYNIAREMMGAKTQKQFEDWAKEEFINRPADMRLLIVVDKLLTGFDAPSASYLYIDKKMQDHGLFQAICRVNRLDCEQKDFGYIVDYQDLFNAMTNAIGDYTAGAFENYDKKDIENLIKDKLKYGKKDLVDALQSVELLCETAGPQTRENFFKYFVCIEQADGGKQEAEIQDNALKREKLYKLVNTL